MPTWIHHLFTPHYTNNHRARTLHLDALCIYVLFFAVCNLGFRFIYHTHPDVLGYATDIRVEQLLLDTNAKRQQAGLNQLRLNTTLSAAAANKAQYMFQKDFWAHVAPDGKTPWDFIIESGYQYTMAGENLAKNFSTSNAVVDAWMASQSHRENLLKPGYQDVGFAVVNGTLNGEQTTLVVQMFGTPKQLAVVPKTIPTPANAGPVTLLNETAPATTSAAQETEISPVPQLLAAYRKPLFDLPTVTRTVAFTFGGFMVALLIIDGYFIARRHTVRISGHSIAHLLFLSALFIGMSAILQGAIL